MKEQLLREWIREKLLSEMAFAKGGFEYEAKLQAMLASADLGPSQATAGAGHGADLVFIDSSGREHGIEAKLSPNVFAGQKNCRYHGGGKWNWGSTDAITEFYDDIGLIDDFILSGPGVQEHMEEFMAYFGSPKLPMSVTNQEYWDFRNENPDFSFELMKVDVTPDAIYANYIQKGVHYIQVGEGYGFYYLDSDPLGLGVPQFAPAKVQVRSRLKWGGSSAGVTAYHSADPEKAADPKVANKRSSISWNNGLVLSGLSPSTVDLEADLSFLIGI